jgi:hypothetical protein
MNFDPKKLRVNDGILFLCDHYDVKKLMVKVESKDRKTKQKQNNVI